MRVSDYVFEYIANFGVDHVFLVVGGGAMFLNDALRKETRITPVCCHHEQACAIAAEGYSRITGGLGVVSVTTGPGGLNTLTGVMGQWTDSIPVLYISGQVKHGTTTHAYPDSGLRQLGDQEINIIDVVKPITKYAAMVTEPEEIKHELEKAIHIATSGRNGPVWLDIPLDVQSATIDETKLVGRDSEEVIDYNLERYNALAILDEIGEARRPLLVVGHGVRLSHSVDCCRQLISQLNIPTVTTFNGFDVVPSDCEQFIGRIGTLGNRAGNFALQNADLVVFLGTRNNIRQTGYDWANFSRNATKIIVDIDQAELDKVTIGKGIKICSDVGGIIENMMDYTRKPKPSSEWLKWCQSRRDKYPVVLDMHRSPDNGINPYEFMEGLTMKLDDHAIVVAGNGTACVSLFQAGSVKRGQRMFWNSGCASMGYDLPAAIGATLASGSQVVCIAGDGSLQMNIQELQTIRQHNLPIKLFILNNQGYHSIVQTQDSFFGCNIGCTLNSGVSFPSYRDLAKMYDMKYFKIDSLSSMEAQIGGLLTFSQQFICEVILPTDYVFAPKASSEKQKDGTLVSKPLEDMYPFLSKDELELNIIKDKP